MHLCLDSCLGPCPARLIGSPHQVSRWPAWTSRARASALIWLYLTLPNSRYNMNFWSFDLVSSPVWLEAETNIVIGRKVQILQRQWAGFLLCKILTWLVLLPVSGAFESEMLRPVNHQNKSSDDLKNALCSLS